MNDRTTPMQKSFIIIKGQAKALQIDSIFRENNGSYAVKFAGRPQVYHYRQSDVNIVKEAKVYFPEVCQVVVNGVVQQTVAEILCFEQNGYKHWRITYTNGFKRDFVKGEGLELRVNCLADATARNVFKYLKSIANANTLGQSQDSEGILVSQYSSIDFIDEGLAVGVYLHPDKVNVQRYSFSPSELIFPFGCNASQKVAVTAAFTDQISVIQGPPGTGKTQTILNIIANILLQGKTVMVVSNNNSAIDNVLEKLQRYDLNFVAASLGSRANKEAFLRNTPRIPKGVAEWEIDKNERSILLDRCKEVLDHLDDVFVKQEKLARLRQELNSLQLEQEHFHKDHNEELPEMKESSRSSKWLMSCWMKAQAMAENMSDTKNRPFIKLWNQVSWWWMYFRLRSVVRTDAINRQNLCQLILQLQSLYYQSRIREISYEIVAIEKYLKNNDSKSLMNELTNGSMRLLKDVVGKKYKDDVVETFTDIKAISRRKDAFCRRFPVVLSTTFSARNSVPGKVFDYVIMDEASQVSVETGALALICARNAVIVGDSKQLPNVVTEEDQLKLNSIFDAYSINAAYNSADYSFLESVCNVIPEVKQTLLREHYRCHPRIINFCNQKYYGGNLLIMTQDHGEPDVLSAILTVPGNHARGHYNQREIDVIREEVLPQTGNTDDVGIISPYNAQVDAINAQLGGNLAATVHKYQGREKDSIIFSVVDDRITEFSDDANLLNVAISRAKCRFRLVVTGNQQPTIGNITDLIGYIQYNNCSVTESNIRSVYDNLYSGYTEARLKLLSASKKVSEYDSENLTFALICKIIKGHSEFDDLDVLCHYPLRLLFSDISPMTEEEIRYSHRPWTHIDFLIFSRVTKKAVLAIETDGYTFHNSQTDQHRRDAMKDSIFSKYTLPLLRLSTVGSGEEEKIIKALKNHSLCYF